MTTTPQDLDSPAYAEINLSNTIHAIDRLAKSLADSRYEGYWDGLNHEGQNNYRSDALETIERMPHLLYLEEEASFVALLALPTP